MNKMTAATTTITTTTTTTRRDFLHLFLMILVVTVAREAQEARAQVFQRANPCVSSEQKGPLFSVIQWGDIPRDFRIKTNCITPIIEELCKNNFPDVDPQKIGPDQKFDRGIPQCIGANCSIDCLHYTFCNKDLNMEMETESVAQKEVDFLRNSLNFYPACNRYIEKMNKTVIRSAGRSCWPQLLCTCGLCCDSTDKMTVMRTMLERTYSDLQNHLQSQRKLTRRTRPLSPRQGRLPRPRIAGYRFDEG